MENDKNRMQEQIDDDIDRGIHFVDTLVGSYAHSIGVPRRVFDRRPVDRLSYWLKVTEEADGT